MIISNSHFGTEMVTTKGKIYKFDAVECLIPELLIKGEDNYAHILVTDFLTPHKLIDAKTSSYLISKKLPSPMGGFLSAYANEENALTSKKQFGGKMYTWEEIVKEYSMNLSND
jgi:copper chaperone NosL